MESKIRNTVKTIKEYSWLIVAYLISCIFYWVFFIKRKDETNTFITKELGDGYFINISSSLISSLLFFLILGFISTIISTILSKVPIENHIYDARVRAIMNSEKVTGNDQAFTFLKKCLSRFLLLNKKMTVWLIIEDVVITPECSVFKIYCEMKYIVANMCRDKDFEPEDIKARVTPGEIVRGSYGHISKLETFNPVNNAPITLVINGNILELTGEYEKELDMKVNGNSEIGWKLGFSIWNKLGEDKTMENQWFNIFIERYTQKIEIYVKNTSCTELKYDLRHIESQKKTPTLLADEAVLRSNEESPPHEPRLEIYPRDLVQLFIYHPKQEEAMNVENGGGGEGH